MIHFAIAIALYAVIVAVFVMAVTTSVPQKTAATGAARLSDPGPRWTFCAICSDLTPAGNPYCTKHKLARQGYELGSPVVHAYAELPPLVLDEAAFLGRKAEEPTLVRCDCGSLYSSVFIAEHKTCEFREVETRAEIAHAAIEERESLLAMG